MRDGHGRGIVTKAATAGVALTAAPERYASGFSHLLMAKDVDLYLEAVEDEDGPASIGRVTASVWDQFSESEPGADFTRIYPIVEGS
jgi:3-hydroxyisobutyrate dehydrogenase